MINQPTADAVGCRNRLTSIGKVVLLDPHFASRHDVGDDVFLGRVLIDSIRVFCNGYHVPCLLIDGAISRLQTGLKIRG